MRKRFDRLLVMNIIPAIANDPPQMTNTMMSVIFSIPSLLNEETIQIVRHTV